MPTIGNAVPLFKAPTMLAAMAARLNCRTPTSADALPAFSGCDAMAIAVVLGKRQPTEATYIKMKKAIG